MTPELEQFIRGLARDARDGNVAAERALLVALVALAINLASIIVIIALVSR